MTIIIISLLLLVSLVPHLTFTVNGKEAKPHSRPYMVSIQLNEKHICGGFLITEEFVLTAAHCRKKKEEQTVVVGAHDLSKTRTLKRYGVKFYIPHPDYRTNRNNIMILKIDKKVKLNNKIKPISLPSDGKHIKAGADCSVAGWGDLWMEGPLSDRLMEANVTTKSDKYCHVKWGSKYVAKHMICVYGQGGSCKADSGGPLVCGNTAVGITSFGDPSVCNSPKHPEVYTKISAYRPWIQSIIPNVK
ncbi:mast cell protease 1A-like isoform X1 [Danio rerio]|uniref:Mast cell protease 1A-like isoform X1 n=1 Tax=Danio rerio TaxID=7955 RepID=A0AC58II25_DANRE